MTINSNSPVCAVTFENFFKMRDHKREAHPKKKQQCEHCGEHVTSLKTQLQGVVTGYSGSPGPRMLSRCSGRLAGGQTGADGWDTAQLVAVCQRDKVAVSCKADIMISWTNWKPSSYSTVKAQIAARNKAA